MLITLLFIINSTDDIKKHVIMNHKNNNENLQTRAGVEANVLFDIGKLSLY